MSAGVKQRGALEVLALRMMDRIQHGRRPYDYQQLAHGLELVLQRTETGFRLGIAREAPARPSETEVKVCRQCFRIPTWAEVEQEQTLRDGKHRNVVNVVWNATGEE